MIIYKSRNFGNTWSVMHYISDSCKNTFGVSAKDPSLVVADDRASPFCAESKITNFKSGERIAFNTKDGRQSSNLEDWTEATNIRVVFLEPNVHPEDRFVYNNLLRKSSLRNRAGFSPHQGIGKDTENAASKLNQRSITSSNTGDLGVKELFKPIDRLNSENNLREMVRNTYYYGVSDFAIGGRCKCNGHASRCVVDKKTGRPYCLCKHNTAGSDCGKCKKFHHDRPWRAATREEPYQCKGKLVRRYF